MSTDLSKVQSFQYPAGHLSHLTESQETALAEFKKIAAEKGYYKPQVEGKDVPSHDDETMLRYLRARRFSPQLAFGQFKDTEDWRHENQLAELYETIDVGEYEETRRLYPQWTGRRDRRGIPVYLFEVAPLNSKAVSAYEQSTSSKSPSLTNSRKAPVKMLRLFALYENLTSFIFPFCTAVADRPNPETPVSQSNNIVDISKVGLKQFWNLKNHMQDASTLATAHYPETLDRIFIIGAPSFFPTVWSWIKRWFDPITVSKIFILSKDQTLPTLSKFIDPSSIPKKYGGELDFSFGDMPILEPAFQSNVTWGEGAGEQRGQKTMPKGPVKWEEGQNGEMVAWAVGHENGQPRRKLVATVDQQFHTTIHPTKTEMPAIEQAMEQAQTQHEEAKADPTASADAPAVAPSADEAAAVPPQPEVAPTPEEPSTNGGTTADETTNGALTNGEASKAATMNEAEPPTDETAQMALGEKAVSAATTAKDAAVAAVGTTSETVTNTGPSERSEDVKVAA